MLSDPRFSKIQSTAAITSLVIARPSSFMTRNETMFAFGAAPGREADAPAAIPATSVPWPE